MLALIGSTLMPIFGRAKRRLGNQLGSAATTGEGTQNLLCAGLSLAILLGLAANLFLGLTWADPLVALVLSVAAVHTGVNTWKGRGCTPAW